MKLWLLLAVVVAASGVLASYNDDGVELSMDQFEVFAQGFLTSSWDDEKPCYFMLGRFLAGEVDDDSEGWEEPLLLVGFPDFADPSRPPSSTELQAAWPSRTEDEAPGELTVDFDAGKIIVPVEKEESQSDSGTLTTPSGSDKDLRVWVNAFEQHGVMVHRGPDPATTDMIDPECAACLKAAPSPESLAAFVGCYLPEAFGRGKCLGLMKEWSDLRHGSPWGRFIKMIHPPWSDGVQDAISFGLTNLAKDLEQADRVGLDVWDGKFDLDGYQQLFSDRNSISNEGEGFLANDNLKRLLADVIREAELAWRTFATKAITAAVMAD